MTTSRLTLTVIPPDLIADLRQCMAMLSRQIDELSRYTVLNLETTSAEPAPAPVRRLHKKAAQSEPVRRPRRKTGPTAPVTEKEPKAARVTGIAGRLIHLIEQGHGKDLDYLTNAVYGKVNARMKNRARAMLRFLVRRQVLVSITRDVWALQEKPKSSPPSRAAKIPPMRRCKCGALVIDTPAKLTEHLTGVHTISVPTPEQIDSYFPSGPIFDNGTDTED